MTDPVVSVSLRCLLALVFASAAWHKVTDFRGFQSTLDAYRLLPSWLVTPVAVGLAVAELGIASALLLPAHHAAALAALGLIILYSAAMVINLARGRFEIDCGCFGPTARVPLSASLLVRNAFLVVAAAVVSLPLSSRRLVWMDAFTIAMVVFATATLWTAFWRLHGALSSGGIR